MAVVNGQCAQWCPAGSTYTNMIKVGNGKNGTSVGQDHGRTNAAGQDVEEWFWHNQIGPLPVDSHTLYLKRSDNSTPVQLILDVPLSKMHEKSNFTSFSTDPLDPSTFAVAGIANCQKAPGCGPAPASKLWHPALELKLSSIEAQA